MNIVNEVFNTVPGDVGSRLPKEQRVYEMLTNLGIDFLRADHDPAATIEDCKDIERLLDVKICKNLFLCNRQKTEFYLLLIDGDKKFRTAVVSKIIGTARLSFGEADFMEEFLDITPGSLSVFGLMNDSGKRVRLLIDKSVTEQEYIGAHPCINTSTLKIRTCDLFDKVIPFMQHEPTVIDIPEDDG